MDVSQLRELALKRKLERQKQSQKQSKQHDQVDASRVAKLRKTDVARVAPTNRSISSSQPAVSVAVSSAPPPRPSNSTRAPDPSLPSLTTRSRAKKPRGRVPKQAACAVVVDDDPSVVQFDPDAAAVPLGNGFALSGGGTLADRTLHPDLIACLRQAGFDSLFPVQQAFVPVALQCRRRRLADPGSGVLGSSDIFLSAATGSGKTLAYIIPILHHILARRDATGSSSWARLRALRRTTALVVVPTRDLAVQVAHTFEKILAPCALHAKSGAKEDSPVGEPWCRVAAVYGAHSFAEERRLLEQGPVDVLIATPGRLVDHLAVTDDLPAGSSTASSLVLDQVQFVVLDEADRLLAQAYHGFLARTLAACVQFNRRGPVQLDFGDSHHGADHVSVSGWHGVAGLASPAARRFADLTDAAFRSAWHQELTRNRSDVGNSAEAVDKLPFGHLPNRPVAAATICGSRRRTGDIPATMAALASNQPSTPLLILCSATLTRKSELIAALGMQYPLLVRSSLAVAQPGGMAAAGADGAAKKSNKKKYSLPESLDQRLLVCTDDSLKLPALLWVIDQHLQQDDNASQDDGSSGRSSAGLMLVFVSSVEATHRLARLLQLLGVRAGEYSGAVSAQARSRALSRFQRGSPPLLVCSDAMARGIDCDGIDVVVSYDCPAAAKTYVHRAGRTARAGAPGMTITLAHGAAARHLKADLEAKVAGGERLEEIPQQPTDDQLRALASRYGLRHALARLNDLLEAETAGRVVTSASLGSQWIAK